MLTFESCVDMKCEINFIPLIYQQKDLIESHNLLIFDIWKMQFVYKICVNSNLQMRKFIRKSLSGFVSYNLTRTSDVYDQEINIGARVKKEEQGKSQYAKYMVGAQFHLVEEDSAKQVNPSNSTLELNEYIVQYHPTKICYCLLVGKKQLLLSHQSTMIRMKTFDEVLLLPYITRNNKFKGSLLVLKEDAIESGEDNRETIDYEKLKVINLLDQEINNIYH